MISTPRDYYVPIIAKSVAPDSYDKLTHAGKYGTGIAYDQNGSELTSSGWNWAQEVTWGVGNTAIMDTLKTIYLFQTRTIIMYSLTLQVLPNL